MEKLFSFEDAAKQLGGVSPWSIRSWLSSGRLRPTKVGARTMISESELERFVAESTKRPRDVRSTRTEQETA